MTVDEINKVVEASRYASQGAADVTAATAGGDYIPVRSDDAGNPMIGDPSAFPPPAGLSDAAKIAYAFGVGHSMGLSAHQCGIPKPEADDGDAEKDPEAYAFISGAAAGWDQSEAIRSAMDRRYADEDDEPNFALDEDEDGLVAHEDDDGVVGLADNEDGAPGSEAETAPATADMVTNPDGSVRERLTFDKIAGGATNSPAAESGSSDS